MITIDIEKSGNQPFVLANLCFIRLNVEKNCVEFIQARETFDYHSLGDWTEPSVHINARLRLHFITILER